jgi:hypothetical protein
VDRVANAVEQAPDLHLRQRVRQPLLRRRSDPFFFPNRSQVRPNVWLNKNCSP